MNNDTLALNEWFEKTDWVQKTCTVDELGMHRADILKKRIDALQAKVDSLMLEFCPEDMTEGQLNNWKLNQNSFRK